MILIFSDVDRVEYLILDYKFCDTYGSIFVSIDAAKKECSQDHQCGGIYQQDNDFRLCEIETIEDWSSNDPLYKKIGDQVLALHFDIILLNLSSRNISI